MRLTVRSDLCRGHGRCYALAEDLLEDDDEGFVTVRGQTSTCLLTTSRTRATRRPLPRGRHHDPRGLSPGYGPTTRRQAPVMSSRTSSSVIRPPGRYHRQTLTIMASTTLASACGSRFGNSFAFMPRSHQCRPLALDLPHQLTRALALGLLLLDWPWRGEEVHVALQDAQLRHLARGHVVRRSDRRLERLTRSDATAVTSRNFSSERSSSMLMIVSRQCALDSK